MLFVVGNIEQVRHELARKSIFAGSSEILITRYNIGYKRENSASQYTLYFHDKRIKIFGFLILLEMRGS